MICRAPARQPVNTHAKMKKQLNSLIQAHLVRSAFYALLLLAVCVIPFALAQRDQGKKGITPEIPPAHQAPQSLLYDQYNNPGQIYIAESATHDTFPADSDFADAGTAAAFTPTYASPAAIEGHLGKTLIFATARG